MAKMMMMAGTALVLGVCNSGYAQQTFPVSGDLTVQSSELSQKIFGALVTKAHKIKEDSQHVVISAADGAIKCEKQMVQDTPVQYSCTLTGGNSWVKAEDKDNTLIGLNSQPASVKLFSEMSVTVDSQELPDGSGNTLNMDTKSVSVTVAGKQNSLNCLSVTNKKTGETVDLECALVNNADQN